MVRIRFPPAESQIEKCRIRPSACKYEPSAPVSAENPAAPVTAEPCSDKQVSRLTRSEPVLIVAARLGDAGIGVKPVRPGGPPLYIAGQADVSVKRAARIGDGLAHREHPAGSAR
jgi:hypothetical protein